MNNTESLREAVRLALDGKAVLFLGAGAARNSNTKDGTPLPTAQELADLLGGECGIGTGYALDIVAEHFIEKYSETRLINVLRKYLTVAAISNGLVTIADPPWMRIWTTNYDNSIELALKSLGVTAYSLTTSANVENARGTRRVVLHINGSIDNLKQSITRDFVLTVQGYATQAFVNTEWSIVFRNDLQLSRALIFVGYSLADIDIARLIFNPAIVANKTHFIDRQGIDPVLETKLSRFGKVNPIGLEKFAEIIKQEKAAWVAPEYAEDYSSWKRITLDDDLKEPTDNDFYDLVLRGICKDSLLRYQSEQPETATYIASRSIEAPCVELLRADNVVAVIASSFANGKTITAQSVSLALASQGKDVFTLDHPYDTVDEELHKLCRRPDDFVLVIENYARNLPLIETFCRYARPSCSLLVTERSEIHELGEHALLDRAKGRNVRTFDLDALDDKEVERVSTLLDLRGLWGERAGLRETQKTAYIKDECGRQLNAVLLDIAHSPEIRTRLSSIVTHFESIEGGLRILIGLCLLQAIGEIPRTNVVAELLDLSSEAFRKVCVDPEAKQILATSTTIAGFRSPVMANAVLQGIRKASVITDVISECVKRGHESRNADRYLGTLAKELMRFSNLERILPKAGRGAALQNFYEGLKTIPTIRNNPHYWLQYAMARLSIGDLDTARRYFEQSYSYAAKLPGYDTFQIDNHYCRLLLREAEDSTDSENAFKAVDEVLTTLRKQVLRENRHYPYRSAWNLEGVTKRHEKNWSVSQKTVVLNGVRYLIDAATRLSPQVARSTAVVGGLQRLQNVVILLS